MGCGDGASHVERPGTASLGRVSTNARWYWRLHCATRRRARGQRLGRSGANEQFGPIRRSTSPCSDPEMELGDSTTGSGGVRRKPIHNNSRPIPDRCVRYASGDQFLATQIQRNTHQNPFRHHLSRPATALPLPRRPDPSEAGLQGRSQVLAMPSSSPTHETSSASPFNAGCDEK